MNILKLCSCDKLKKCSKQVLTLAVSVPAVATGVGGGSRSWAWYDTMAASRRRLKWGCDQRSRAIKGPCCRPIPGLERHAARTAEVPGHAARPSPRPPATRWAAGLARARPAPSGSGPGASWPGCGLVVQHLDQTRDAGGAFGVTDGGLHRTGGRRLPRLGRRFRCRRIALRACRCRGPRRRPLHPRVAIRKPAQLALSPAADRAHRAAAHGGAGRLLLLDVDAVAGGAAARPAPSCARSRRRKRRRTAASIGASSRLCEVAMVMCGCSSPPASAKSCSPLWMLSGGQMNGRQRQHAVISVLLGPRRARNSRPEQQQAS